MSKPTQTARVLAALRFRGADGITRVDFMPPNVIDGGKPILNIPGRIYDLKGDGHEIIDAGERDACTVYRLLRDTQDNKPVSPARPVSPPTLGENAFAHRPRNAIFDDDWEAA